jgi:muramoyltetrapeptide carboxypeptidase
MIVPSYLQRGDKIGIAAPARWITEDQLKPALDIFIDWGLIPVIGNHVFDQKDQLAGTDEERASDLQVFLDDPTIKAVICVRGGYGTIRILPMLDFKSFKQKPKWIIGYSDITVLHSYINSYLKIETMHATMPVMFPSDGKENINVLSLKKALFGEKIIYNILPNPLNRQGYANAELAGGNLSVLYSLAGTLFDIDVADKVLFIEDVDEYLYHIDRMMMNLRFSGKLNQVKGIIIGGLSEMHDNQIPFGRDAYQIVKESVKDYSFPVVFDFPAGHIEDNRAFILGRKIEMEVTENVVIINF